MMTVSCFGFSAVGSGVAPTSVNQPRYCDFLFFLKSATNASMGLGGLSSGGSEPRKSKNSAIASRIIYDSLRSCSCPKAARASFIGSSSLVYAASVILFMICEKCNNVNRVLTYRNKPRILMVNKQTSHQSASNTLMALTREPVGGIHVANNNSNPAPVAAQTKPNFFIPVANWMDRLTEEPAISPNFSLTLCEYIGMCMIDWLKQNAPREIVNLYFTHSALREYYAEFEISRGLVSKNANEEIMSAIKDSINSLDKLGFTGFESMG